LSEALLLDETSTKDVARKQPTPDMALAAGKKKRHYNVMMLWNPIKTQIRSRISPLQAFFLHFKPV
jgi:hypothetical protein